MNCDTCKEKRADPVPYIVHESAMARQERTVKRLWIVLILVLLMLFGSNAAWIWYESQYETVTVTQEVEQEAENGSNRFVGGDYYGTSESDDDG